MIRQLQIALDALVQAIERLLPLLRILSDLLHGGCNCVAAFL
jgi:hypothetical protein